MANPDYVGENLRRIRRRKKLSQQALSKRSGVGTASISHAETGAHQPEHSTLQKLADALEVPVEGFYQRPEDIASLLRLNKILTDDILRAREEGQEERLDDLRIELERVTMLLNRFGPFFEPEPSRKRRERLRTQAIAQGYDPRSLREEELTEGLG
jgi:transcriptional regulator with XRE-family HTH domain